MGGLIGVTKATLLLQNLTIIAKFSIKFKFSLTADYLGGICSLCGKLKVENTTLVVEFVTVGDVERVNIGGFGGQLN